MKKRYKIGLTFYLSLCGILGLKAQSWNQQYYSPSLEINEIVFYDQDNGWFFADSAFNGTFISGNLYRTNNHGSTWQTQDMGANNYRIFSCSIIGTNNLFAGGRDALGGGNTGLFVKSHDGGLTWTNLSNFPERIRAVCFVDINHGWVMGKNGFISESLDGGVTWQTLSLGISEDIMDMEFFDANIGIVVCSGGEIYRTINGGTTWNLINTGSQEDFEKVSLVGVSDAWVCGSAGTILHSSDGGLTWILQNTNTQNDLASISMADLNFGVCVGIAGEFLMTTDGGINWNVQIPLSPEDYSAVCVKNSNSAWIGNITGELYGLDNPTKIKSKDSSIQEQLFPNPATNLINISLNSKDGDDFMIIIKDISGKVVLQRPSEGIKTNFPINIEAFESGIYLVEISDKNLKKNVFKFIKH